MSNALRSFQRTKARKGLGTRGVKKGPARAEPIRPPPPVVPTPKGPVDISKANPSCKTCYGTGWGPTLVGKDDHRTKHICNCVRRGMTGNAPWLKGKRA